MIIINSNREDFLYDIQCVIKPFFSKEEISCVVGDDQDKKPFIYGRIDYEEDLTAGITVSIDEETVGDRVSKAASDFYERTLEPISDKSARRDSLKRIFYEIFSEITGKTLPWGILTGIRPTKIAVKDFDEGRDEDYALEHLKKEYYVSDEKCRLATEIARHEREIISKIDVKNGYSLYVGIPFCPTTCLYCSFTSYPLSRYADLVDTYLDALEKEISFTGERFKDKTLDTIYIGGGTPTTLSPGQMDRLITMIKNNLDISHIKEFTVEAGRPDSITREKLEVIKKHGINRISINPQTMKQETLDFIGRRHSVDDIKNAYALAREIGFDTINMDIILGLPSETIDDVRATMREIKALAPENLTVHSLAIKRASRLGMKLAELKEKGEYNNPYDIVNSEEHQRVCESVALEMGMQPYYMYRQKNMAGNLENTGYSLPGHEGIYNILIMEEVQSIVACGAGTVTKRVYPTGGRIERCDCVKEVPMYIDRIDEMIDRKRRLFLD